MSGRVVNTSMSTSSWPSTGNRTDAPVRAADPVALHQLDRVGPVERVEVVEQAVGVRGDAQHPLLQRTAVHREVAALAAPVGGDLFVGEHRAEPGAPVDRRLGLVREPVRVDELRAARAAPRSSNGTSSGVANAARRGAPAPARRSAGRGRRRRRTRSCRSAGRSTASSGSTATSVVAGPRRGSWPRPSARSWRLHGGDVLPRSSTRGCVPVCTAYCSAGRPNAS